MKKIIYALLATVSGLVLMFSYRTSLEAVTPTTELATGTATTSDAASGASPASGTGATPAAGASDPSTAAAASPGSSASASSGLADGTYLGAAVNTRYGPVQVQLTVSDGKVTDVQVPEYPSSNGRDRQINESAIPRLVSETTQAQSAQIDMVSGATYTSQGYLTSLQSAIDQAQS